MLRFGCKFIEIFFFLIFFGPEGITLYRRAFTYTQYFFFHHHHRHYRALLVQGAL